MTSLTATSDTQCDELITVRWKCQTCGAAGICEGCARVGHDHKTTKGGA